MKYPGEKIFVLNPAYNLRADRKRVILFNSSIDAAVRMDASDILVCLHPLLAVILSLFDGKKQLGEIINELVKILKLSEKAIVKFVEPLLNNDDELQFVYDGHHYYLPKNLLIETEPAIFFREFYLK